MNAGNLKMLNNLYQFNNDFIRVWHIVAVDHQKKNH